MTQGYRRVTLGMVRASDTVRRLIGGQLAMYLKVTKVTDTEIHCGDWRFAKSTGGELDEDLGWTEHATGSVIEPLSSPRINITGLSAAIDQAEADVKGA